MRPFPPSVNTKGILLSPCRHRPRIKHTTPVVAKRPHMECHPRQPRELFGPAPHLSSASDASFSYFARVAPCAVAHAFDASLAIISGVTATASLSPISASTECSPFAGAPAVSATATALLKGNLSRSASVCAGVVDVFGSACLDQCLCVLVWWTRHFSNEVQVWYM